MDPRLIITNVGYAVSVFFTLGLGIFVLYKGPRRQPNIVFFLMSVALAVFQISHLIGINISDPAISREVFMWNLTNIFMAIFICHYSLIVARRLERARAWLIAFYISGVALLGACLLFPYQFLQDSVPKLYLPSYYVPGPLYTVMRVYFVAVLLFGFWHLISALLSTQDPVEKNRMKYVLAATIYGSIVGTSAVLLVYNIPFDPLWSMFFSLYTIPMAYAIVQYDLMEIHIAFKKALYWSAGIVAAGIAISLLNYSDVWLVARVPDFPGWLFPFATSLAAVAIGIAVWKKLKEGEALKEEFIATVTHKFLPPLGHIRDAAAELSRMLPPEGQSRIAEIQDADARLDELTKILAGMTDSENGAIEYFFEKADLSALARQVLSNNSAEIARKNIAATFQADPECLVFCDMQKTGFALQTLIENAILYTPPGRSVFVSVAKREGSSMFQVRDSGIGITAEEMPYLFTKLYRGSSARELNADGIGVALRMSRIFIEKSGGKLWAESEGQGKGAALFFTLPEAPR